MKRTKTVSRTLEVDGVCIDVVEPKREADRNGNVLAYVAGFGEPNHWNDNFFHAIARSGGRILSPRIVPGQDRRKILETVTNTGEFKDSDAEQRAVMAHSAGGLAVGGTLLPDEAQMLADEMEIMILSNVPLDPKLSKTKLVMRFIRSAIKEAVTRKRPISALVHELGDMVSWSMQGNVLQEIHSISANTLHENIDTLTSAFGNKLKVIVDTENDVLCPAEFMVDALRKYDGLPVGQRPHLVEVPYRHGPNVNMPHYMATIVQGLHNMPRVLRSLKQKFAHRLQRKRRFEAQ